MSCDITKGRKEPCKDVVGGLKALYFINFDASLYKTAKAALANGLVKNLKAQGGNAVDLYKWELRSSGHNLEDENEQSPENGTSFFNPTITAIIKKVDAESREELLLASYGRPHIIAEDYNGNFFLVGAENGLDVQVNMVSGSAMGELNGYNLTITGQEKELSFLVDPTIIGDGDETVVIQGS